MSDVTKRRDAAQSVVAVVGAQGLLGSALMRQLTTSTVFSGVGLDCDDCDIRDAESIRRAIDVARPDVVINCAAFTQVDACETEVEAAFLANAEGAGNVATAAKAANARLIHISTDYVFDGSAIEPIGVDALPGPEVELSVYGRTKLEGERRVLAAHDAAVIVRTAWLYGCQGAGFPKAILRQARDVGRLRVVNDQTGSPTYADDLAAALLRIAAANVRGVFHVTNAGHCTWFEFAREILRVAGLHDVSIDPVPTSAYPRPAKRPAYSVLDNARFDCEVGPPLQHWRDGLAAYFKQSGDV